MTRVYTIQNKNVMGTAPYLINLFFSVLCILAVSLPKNLYITEKSIYLASLVVYAEKRKKVYRKLQSRMKVKRRGWNPGPYAYEASESIATRLPSPSKVFFAGYFL